jgi:hypothetical protein
LFKIYFYIIFLYKWIIYGLYTTKYYNKFRSFKFFN